MKKETTLVWPPTSMEMTWAKYQSFLQVRKAGSFLAHVNLSAIFVSRIYLRAKTFWPQLYEKKEILHPDSVVQSMIINPWLS